MSIFTPTEITDNYVKASVGKAASPAWRLFVLGIAAGLLIGLGAVASSTAAHALADTGMVRLVSGLVFPLGLIMVILLGAERYSRMTCVLAEMAHDAGCRLIVITDKLTAPFAGDADIVLLADLSSPSPTNSYIGVNFLIEAIAFEFSRTLGVYPQQRLSRLDAYLSELQLY